MGAARPQSRVEEPRTELVPVCLDGLEETRLEPIRFVGYPVLLPRSNLTLLGGNGGSGKSSLALTCAVCAAAGRTLHGEPVDPVSVVFISLEDPPELVRDRIARTIREFVLDPDLVRQNFRLFDGSGSDSALAVEINVRGISRIRPTDTAKSLASLCAGSALVVIDNASDAFAGNENSRHQVRDFLRSLTRLAQDLGAAVVLLVHIDKQAAKFGGNGQSYSGSTAWHNTARTRYALTPGKSGGVELKMEKNNLGPLLEPLFFTWTKAGVLVPATGIAGQGDDHASGIDNASVMEALRSLVEVGAPITTARTGPSTALNVVMTTPECPVWLKSSGRPTPEGKERFWSAVTRLERIGWIARKVERTPDRKERERYVLGPNCPDNYRKPRQWAGGNP